MPFAVPDTPRFQSWSIVFTLSCVCVASHASQTIDTDVSKWVLTAICVSLVLSFCGVVSYMTILEKFQGRNESVTASLLVIFWAASLPFIMDPSNNIAITANNFAIVNANLYFFSWAAFGYSLLIFTQVALEIAAKPNGKIAKWFGLLVSSIIVVASSSQYGNVSCPSEVDGLSTCGRNSYAISVGALGLVIPAIVLVLTMVKKMAAKLEFAISFLMFLLYIFAVGLVTFGDGPASKSVSNLYFSTWVGFALSLVLAFDCFKALVEPETEKVIEDDKEGFEGTPAPIIEDFEEVETRLEEDRKDIPSQEQGRTEKNWLDRADDEDKSVNPDTIGEDYEETEV
mmetsp:Transcript_35135/g.38849  ORF Transcript_35135/g.38849 Transcript_35135/m.38849 type:complete len:342 (+) Transcript_35135:60-1085(+)